MRSKITKEEEKLLLFKIVAKTESVEQVKDLFEKILSERELNDISRRLLVWNLLREGKTYSEIQEKMKMSASTISKISGLFGYGELEKRRAESSGPLGARQIKRKRPIRKYKGATSFHRAFIN